MQKNFSNIFSYIDYFKKLIEVERREDRKQHHEEILKFSPQKRERVGRAILNLQGKPAGRGLGKTFLVKFTSSIELDHSIQIGDLVIVTQRVKPNGLEQQGTVVSKSKSMITVAYLQRPSSYHYQENLRLDLFTNDVVFQRQLSALQKMKGAWPLKRNLLGQPLFNHGKKLQKSFEFENSRLNLKQQNAIKSIINTEDFFLLHGPPGTGKTTTLVEAILQFAKQGKRVLVCCDSNQGVDNILDKLSRFTTKNIVRIGNPSRIDSDLTKLSLDSMLESNEFYKEALSLYEQVDHYFKLQKQYQKPTKDLTRGLSDAQIIRFSRERKAVRGVPAPLIRKMGQWLEYQYMIRELQEKIKRFESHAVEEILLSKQIICTTNSFSGGDLLEEFLVITKKTFDVVVVDEATQATEPSCLVPGTLAPRLILAGDHKQLPPTVIGGDDSLPLRYSLFERLIDIYGKERSLMLDTQYRMNEKIMSFSNKHYYEGKLICGNENKGWTLEKDYFGNNPLIFIDSLNSKEEKKEHSTSYFNTIECSIVEKLVFKYLKEYSSSEIGIITPYDAQVRELKKRITDVKISSIDGFQGGEREIIIISFVRSNSKGTLGFLQDFRRLNVGITRAKKKLILIGNYTTLSSNQEYRELLDLAEHINIDL
ncbi:MAG: IGHMBP2 family helicase [Nanoarchaeota archaeon]|nr:IGHMBP2 family helicase [Nanoarchaeota archaeon]